MDVRDNFEKKRRHILNNVVVTIQILHLILFMISNIVNGPLATENDFV